MDNLIPTNLVIVSAPLPADFEGTPQELHEAMVERYEIKSPSGTNFFVSGDVEPATNQGPWLKGGTQWWVFDPVAGGYVPQDISASTSRLFTASVDAPPAPGANDATVWLRVVTGRVIGWYFWTGSEWRPGGNVPASGPTSSRPPDSNVKELEQYFDTDIKALIHWERGKWRTVSGTPGDVKFVTTLTLAEALASNPGWAYLGATNQDWIGRTIGLASKDPGATPDASFATSSGISARARGDIPGAETHVLTSDEIEQHTHLVGASTALNSGNRVQFYRVDDGENFTGPSPRPPNHTIITGVTPGSPPVYATRDGDFPTAPDGTMMVTSKQLSLATASDDSYTEPSDAHNNMQPTLFLWGLTKE